MELLDAYFYRQPGEFQAAINRQKANNGQMSGFWVTQEGIVLRPREMRDSHLLNCMAVTEKRNKNRPIRELAEKILNHSYRKADYNFIDRELSKALRKSNTYIEMYREAKRRGLI